MTDSYFKYPRLYGNHSLSQGQSCPLDEAQAHYLRNVLRKNAGDRLRVFNGCDGEWLCEVEALTKKSVVVHAIEQIHMQPAPPQKLALAFAPIKKQRMDILIEKGVELGVTDFYPVLTQHTENRHLKDERIERQIIEASEQCERLDLPTFHAVQNLDAFVTDYQGGIFAAIERDADAQKLSDCPMVGDVTFLMGPEGGWSSDEVEMLRAHENITSISLGERILRAETAGISMVSFASLSYAR